jgi:uncharacterized protein (UPF0335 family)
MQRYPQMPFSPGCFGREDPMRGEVHSGNTVGWGQVEGLVPKDGEVALNQQVKDLIQKLGEAIHESVSESDQISGVVREIREQGFDVLLMLEATIGLNEVDESDEAEGEDDGETGITIDGGPFTRHDLTFLKSLRITTEEDGVPGAAPTQAAESGEDPPPPSVRLLPRPEHPSPGA